MRIGIDIGGMSVKLGIVDEECNIIDKQTIPTRAQDQSPKKIAETMASVIDELAKKNQLKLSDCICVGFACPGTVDSRSGMVLYSNNLGWENFSLIEIMRSYFDVPMAIANDADAAVLGEVKNGAAKDKKNAVLLTLGTGVGGGVILDGRIFGGSLRGGCEPGHMVIQQGGRLCTCGRRGCLEQYASATALMTLAREATEQNSHTLLGEMCGHNLSALSGKHVFEAARQGDAAALEVIEKYQEALSAGIANLINIFRPEIVILGGGISAQGSNLTLALQNRVSALCFGGRHGEIPPIVTSVLGNDAGIIGAAFLCE